MGGLFNMFSKPKQIILFYGASGWIGSMYLQYLKQDDKTKKFEIVLGKARLDNKIEVLTELSVLKPNYVFQELRNKKTRRFNES
jgi:hypothetical protein